MTILVQNLKQSQKLLFPQVVIALEPGFFWYMLTTRYFLYLMLQVLPGLEFCYTYLGDILIYSVSWKDHLQHLEIVFRHLTQSFNGHHNAKQPFTHLKQTLCKEPILQFPSTEETVHVLH